MTSIRAVAQELGVASVLASLFVVTPTFAVDVRQPDGGGHYHADLVRAYAPCLTPNTTAFGGEPACSPAVTSVCGYEPASVDMETWDKFPPEVRILPHSGAVSGPCEREDWVAQLGLRLSAEQSPHLAELPCPSGRCTFADVVYPWELHYGGQGVLGMPYHYFWNANVEISAIRIVDAGGVPIVASGVGSPVDARLVSNLTLPYPACPDDVCDVTPWTSPCDFETGDIEWTRDAATSAARVHATLRDVTGSSPLCTTGTYQVQATVRPTVYGCGHPSNPTLCTLVDQPVVVSLQAEGRTLDTDGLVQVGTHPYVYASMEILDSRVLDPTGVVVATAGITGVRPVSSPSLVIKGSNLKMRAVLGLDHPSVDPPLTVDPTADGLTVTLLDRDEVVYQVTIPAERWQLQPPIGTRWDFVDENGILGGVRKARLRRITKKDVVLGYQLDLRAKGADLAAALFPGFTVRIDVTSTSILGGVATLTSESHRTCKGAPGRFTCK